MEIVIRAEDTAFPITWGYSLLTVVIENLKLLAFLVTFRNSKEKYPNIVKKKLYAKILETFNQNVLLVINLIRKIKIKLNIL